MYVYVYNIFLMNGLLIILYEYKWEVISLSWSGDLQNR